MKTCTKCGIEKSFNAFPKRPSNKDGRRDQCRVCYGKTIEMWRAQNVDKVRSYARDWARRNPEYGYESSRKHRLENPEYHRAAYRKWCSANQEKAAAATQTWLLRNPDWKKLYQEANRDILREKNRRWQRANPVKVREKTRRYQASRQGATPFWLTAIQLAQIQEFYEIAEALQMQTNIKYHVDHVHPLNGEIICGLHVPWNLQVLPYDENIRKSNTLGVP